MQSNQWITGKTPAETGWYAVSYTWAVEEGIFPGASYWDGSVWNPDYPIGAYYGTFQDKASAEEWARDHDMEA